MDNTQTGTAHRQDFWFVVSRPDTERPLWHPQIELLFLLRGEAELTLDGGDRSYTLHERDIVVINSLQVHTLRLGSGAAALSLFVSLQFAASVNPALLSSKIDCRSFLFGPNQQQPFDTLRKAMAEAFEEQVKWEDRPEQVSRSKIGAVLEVLSREFLDRDAALPAGGGLKALRPALTYIQMHYREPLSLSDLAKETYLSEAYISRSFTKYFKVPFTEYLASLRLTAACRALSGSQTISEIALECGFPSANALIAAFRHHLGMTPGAYRKKLLSDSQAGSGKPELNRPENDLFASIFAYGQTVPGTEGEHQETESEQGCSGVQEIRTDVSGRKKRMPSHWRRILNAGYAGSVTDERIQKEIHRLLGSVGFDYIRIKGVLDDDMCILRRDMNGQEILNFARLDEVLDFILSTGARPMLDFGTVPALLAGEKNFTSMRGEIMGIPKDKKRWLELLNAVLSHLKQRYTKEKMRQWLFSPWMLPDYVDFGIGSLVEHEKMYKAAYHCVKESCPDFLVAAPGSSDLKRYLPWFLSMAKRGNVLPDVLTFRSFGAVTEPEEDGMNLIGNNESFSFAVSKDEDLLKHKIRGIRELMERTGTETLPLVLEEWSNNVWQRDLANDTCFKSAYIFKNILENNEALNGFGYFTINDRIDEVPPAQDTFHGGFGLFTRNDIPKSACLAMELLGKMGDRILAKGKGFCVTGREDTIQIFLYHYCHYDLLYRYRHVAGISRTKRDGVFLPGGPGHFFIQLEHMRPGSYQIIRYKISQTTGSAYDEWVAMGAPEPMSREETERLKRLAVPGYERCVQTVKDGSLSLKEDLKPHEVCLIEIKMG